MALQKITPFLWFDNQAEEAAKFYTSIFKNSKIHTTTRYGTEGQEITGGKPGSVMTVEFEIEGQNFVALNGGPIFKFNEAVSFVISCKDQKEVDYFWEKLTTNGGQKSQCGWCKDKFGLSWQVVPEEFNKLMSSGKQENVERMTKVLLTMEKLDMAVLKKAYDGK
jgi:predicted 3-demethylubiquinone-9 3-methyltransferase (glyoxalase superfamily)